MDQVQGELETLKPKLSELLTFLDDGKMKERPAPSSPMVDEQLPSHSADDLRELVAKTVRDLGDLHFRVNQTEAVLETLRKPKVFEPSSTELRELKAELEDRAEKMEEEL